MKSINRVILLGRLGSAPELRHTSTGKAFCRLNLATSVRFRRNEEWVEVTDWHSVVVWEQVANYVSQYLGKGDPCIIEGRLSSRSFEDAQGSRRKFVEVVGERVTALPASGISRNRSPEVATDMPEPEAVTATPPMEEAAACEEIPF